jgi:hypothetical protein
MPGLRRGVVALAVAVSTAAVSIQLSAQNGPVAGRNVNLVGGPTMITLNPFELVGDPFRAQQNEGSCGVSARDPFVGHAGNDYTHIYFSRSLDCGAKFSHPVKLSEGNFKNQGPQVTVVPGSNQVVVAWRRGAAKKAPDALMVTQSSNGGSSFSHAFPVSLGLADVVYRAPSLTPGARV